MIPASLFGRLTLILVAGLLVAQFTTVWLHLGDRAWLILRGEIQAAGIPSRFWVHMALTLMAVIAASLIAVRMDTRPMRRLAEAGTRTVQFGSAGGEGQHVAEVVERAQAEVYE